MSWRGALTLVLLAAAIVSGWSAWRQRAGEIVAAPGPVRSDYVLHDFEIISLDKDGTEAFTVRAPLLEQHPEDRTIALETPLFLLPDRDGRYWQTRSKTGWISADHDEVRLQGDVQVDGPEDDPRPVTMNTERLNVFPETRIARTDDQVTVTQPGSTIQGRGMEVDLSTKRYQFHSQVKQRYVPTRR